MNPGIVNISFCGGILKIIFCKIYISRPVESKHFQKPQTRVGGPGRRRQVHLGWCRICFFPARLNKRKTIKRRCLISPLNIMLKRLPRSRAYSQRMRKQLRGGEARYGLAVMRGVNKG